MKKFLLFFFMLMGALVAQATVVTFTVDSGDTSSDSMILSQDGVTITCDNGLLNSQIRFYAYSTTTIKSTIGSIISIEFTCTASGTDKYGPGCFTLNSDGSYEYDEYVGTWTGEATSVEFYAEKQLRATSIVVTVADSDSDSDGDEDKDSNDEADDSQTELYNKICDEIDAYNDALDAAMMDILETYGYQVFNALMSMYEEIANALSDCRDYLDMAYTAGDINEDDFNLGEVDIWISYLYYYAELYAEELGSGASYECTTYPSSVDNEMTSVSSIDTVYIYCEEGIYPDTWDAGETVYVWNESDKVVANGATFNPIDNPEWSWDVDGEVPDCVEVEIPLTETISEAGIYYLEIYEYTFALGLELDGYNDWIFTAFEVTGTSGNLQVSGSFEKNGKIYSISGASLNKALKGVNIVNGKKVLVK